jgi:hypothetical protein
VHIGGSGLSYGFLMGLMDRLDGNWSRFLGEHRHTAQRPPTNLSFYQQLDQQLAGLNAGHHDVLWIDTFVGRPVPARPW